MLSSSFCILFYTVFLCSWYLVFTFNVEELKWTNYEVDISAHPVKKKGINQPAVYITSRSGQEFQCVLPQLKEEEISEKEVVNDKDTDVLELLKPMKSRSCLTKGKDWWSYEFCFGRHIKQFHVEDGKIVGEVVTLGLYESDYVWNNETDQEKFKQTKQKYHSQYYANGAKCDITGQPRNAEVRFYCEEDAGDYIYRIDEPGTCSYIITVHTSRICSHPLLKPPPSNNALPITCHPLLNEEHYANYLQKLEEEKARAEEERNKWLSNQQERLQMMKNEHLLPLSDKKEILSEIHMNLKHKASNLKMLYEKVRSSVIAEKNKEIEKYKALLPPENFSLLKKIIEQQFDTILEDLLEAENKAKFTVFDVPEDSSLDNRQKKKTNEMKANADTSKIISSDQSQTTVLDGDKVRIQRRDHKSSASSSKLHEMDFKERKRLEQLIKKKLEKAGFGNGDNGIEINLVTAHYFGDEDKGFQALTDEDFDQFRYKIIALMTGQPEVVQEMKRHKKLEENYKFTWDESEDLENKDD